MAQNSDEQFPDGLVVEYPRSEVQEIGCIDKRRLAAARYLFTSGFFQQIAGSRWGIGNMTGLAMEVGDPNSFIRLSTPTGNFAQEFGNFLLAKNVLSVQHGPTCGAIEAASNAHNGIANGPDPTKYWYATRFKPDLTEDRYVKVVDAARRIRREGLASDPDGVKRALAGKASTPRTGLFVPGMSPATPYVDLVPDTPRNIAHVIDYRPNIAFDQAAAVRVGRAAYYTTAAAWANILRVAPDSIADRVDLSTIYDVQAVVLGEIAAAHIVHHNEDGTIRPYPITTIGYEAAV